MPSGKVKVLSVNKNNDTLHGARSTTSPSSALANVTQSQADSALNQVLEYYDLGEYAEGLQSFHLSGKKKAEILAEIAVSGTPTQRMQALRDLDRLLDRNMKAGGYIQQGSASKEVDGVTVTSTFVGIREASRVSKMLRNGLGNDSFPLYAKDEKHVPILTSEKDKCVANPTNPTNEKGDNNGKSQVEDTKEEQPENDRSNHIEIGTAAAGCTKGGLGSSDSRCNDEDAGPSTPVFCEPFSTADDSRRHRHIGHFPPCTHVPGGGVTGVPPGADPYTYGEKECVSVEEARRLAQRSSNEGFSEDELRRSAIARDNERAADETIRKTKEEGDSRQRGRSITTSRVGGVLMYDVVGEQPKET